MAQYKGSFTFTPGNISSIMLVVAYGNISGGASAIIDGTSQGSIDSGLQGLEDWMEAQGAVVTTLSGLKVGASLKITYDYIYSPDTSFPFYFADVEGTDYLILVPEIGSTACDTCQEKVMSACEASYTIVAGLTAATEYTVVLIDRNEVRYTQAITADSSGDLTIDMTDIPSGLSTPEGGGFLLEVYEDEELTSKADITANGHVYGCIQLTFQHTVTTTNSLGYPFDTLATELDFTVDEYGNTFICV